MAQLDIEKLIKFVTRDRVEKSKGLEWNLA